MSTRKSTLASSTVQGTKAENATATGTGTSTAASSSPTPATSKALDTKSNSASTTAAVAGKQELTQEANKLDKSEVSTDSKPFHQRVTRNSPLLLPSPLLIKKEPLDSIEQTNSEPEEGGSLTARKQTTIKGRKSIKEHKEAKEHQEDKGKKEESSSESKEKEKEDKEKDKAGRETTDTKDQKESSNAKDSANTTSHTSTVSSSASSTTTTVATCRLTRKATAIQENSNTSSTRITRQRQTSGGATATTTVSTRSETPPARNRCRSSNRVKMPLPMVEPAIAAAAKRKRSVDSDAPATNTRKTSSDEPGPKYIKIEVTDPDIDNDEPMPASQASTESNEDMVVAANIKIKQEIVDDSEVETNSNAGVDTEINISKDISVSGAAHSTTSVRSKARMATRKSNAATTTNTNTSNNSPSTRATRHTRQTSPVQTAASIESKRRRMGSQTRSLLKTNQSNCSKTNSINPEEDEDSKDSMASSTNTDDIVLSQIKAEQLNQDIDEFISEGNKEDATVVVESEVKDTEKVNKEKDNCCDLPMPLSVDVEPVSSANTKEILESAIALSPVASNTSPSVASGSEKAASLSPSDLVSEGVSEISVKQFYKKPKFLENNLGIEEDPKLGNIVQKVVGLETNLAVETIPASTSAVSISTAEELNKETILEESFSNESMKEGTLRFEECLEDGKTTIQDDANSLSSDDKLTALVVDEDDDEVEDAVEENKETEIEQETVSEQLDEDVAKEEDKVELKVSECDSNIDDIVLDDNDDKENKAEQGEEEKPTIVVEDEEPEEDELTIEESETISMDNNASVNDDATNEIEEDAENEEDLVADIEDIAPVATEILSDKVDSELSGPLQMTEEDSQSSDGHLVIDHKDSEENGNNTDLDDDDKDVLAKIDAELKKIDERRKEKLNAIKTTIPQPVEIAANNKPMLEEEEEEKKEDTKTELVVQQIGAMDVDAVIDDIKDVPVDDEKSNVREDLIDDIELKSDDGQPTLDLSEIKLSEDSKFEEEDNKDESLLMKHEESKIETKQTTSELIVPPSLHLSKADESDIGTAESPKTKSSLIIKDDDATSMKSNQSTNSWVTLDFENDDEESLRKKELHLQTLGLVTHKAAEKRRLEVIQSSAAAVEANKAASQHHNKRNGKNSSHAASTHHEYTGTLKTIIKLNRNSTGGSTSGNNGRKSNAAGTSSSSVASKEQQQRRQSLKMTFQKGRGRTHGATNSDRSQHDREGQADDHYYTIQNETEGAPYSKFHTKSTTSTNTRLALNHQTNNNSSVTNNNCKISSNSTYARKSYNYRNSTSYSNHHSQHYNSSVTTSSCSAHSLKMDSSHSESHDHQSTTTSGVSTKKDEKILIPEKASSFKFHPGRLCEDQCYYCSGKFGLYDTPCHVGQIKSMERQQKILANEEKLTVDNCLCDACFRHVDRRANVPSYKKRLSAPGGLETANGLKSSDNPDEDNADAEGNADHYAAAASHRCLVTDCTNAAAHSLRRKCIRKSVKKFLLKFEVPTNAACIWLCQSHYDTVIQCSGCVLCKRRLGKNHMYHITSDTDRLEKALSEMGIPVQLGIGTAVCKLCRYFANLLMKPPDSSKSQKAEFVKNYRKRLLQFHNIHDGSNDASEADEDDSNGPSAHSQNAELQQQKTPQKPITSPEDGLSSSNQKDPLSPLNSRHSIENEFSDQSKTKTNASANLAESAADTVDRDFLTDSSNSSASNTASHSPKEMSKLKAILQSNSNVDKAGAAGGSSSDISNVLRANPNISMRELFPGEEDLGLQFKVPFGSNASQRTPEGWTRVQTFLQYDEPTRRLWEELQKPYGNQSSFLRHLILLEKYFRNGDLILSASASNNASVYTQTVRQRLTSYDKGHCGGLQGPLTSHREPAKPKEAEAPPSIPTYEINEDDDDDDDDVEITQVEKAVKPSNSLQDMIASNSANQQHQRSRSLSVDKLTKQLSTNAVTITARPKDPASNKRTTPSPQKSLLKDSNTGITNNQQSSANLAAANAAAAVALAASTAAANQNAGPSNSRSILKCNLLGINKSVEIVPINNSPSNAPLSVANKPTNISVSAPQPPPPPPPAPVESKQQKILDVANKLLGNQMDVTSASKNPASLLSSPPELVSLQRRSAGHAPTLPPSTTVNIAPNNHSNNNNNNNNNTNNNNNNSNNNSNKRPQLLSKPGSSRPPPNVVILPDTLTPQERLQSKTWRPTLMPVEENQNLVNKNGPLYQTADGRRLPALVQVQSGGKPFLISIFDYNRMCILRREKLMRDQMLKATKKRQEAKQQSQQQHQQQQHQQQQHQQQQQQMAQHHQQQQHQQQQQQQQQHLQNKNVQNMNKNFANASAVANQRQQQQQHQHQQHAAQQQLLQLQLLQHQQALLKAVVNNNSSNSQASNRYQSIAPKPPATNTNINANMPPLQSSLNSNSAFPAPMMPMLANAITNAANTGNVNPASNTMNNTSWLWNNFPDANQLLLNGAGGGAGASGGGIAATTSNTMQKLPQLLAKPNHPNNPASVNAASYAMKQQQQQQQLLLSKIPKSLTVIPQHKLMNAAISGNVGGNSMKE